MKKKTIPELARFWRHYFHSVGLTEEQAERDPEQQYFHVRIGDTNSERYSRARVSRSFTRPGGVEPEARNKAPGV